MMSGGEIGRALTVTGDVLMIETTMPMTGHLSCDLSRQMEMHVSTVITAVWLS